jgi:transcriptional regulator with XRE-family HTH domain
VQIPKLKVWRETMGETQVSLSELSGIAEHTISRIEHGAGTRPSTARKLAEALGISVADLVEAPPVPLVPSGKAEAPAEDSGLVRAAKYHANMGARLAEVLEPELKGREEAGDIKWLTRVSMLLIDYGAVLKEILENVTLPDKETKEEIVAKGMDLNKFWKDVQDALAHARPHAEPGSAEAWREIAKQALDEMLHEQSEKLERRV